MEKEISVYFKVYRAPTLADMQREAEHGRLRQALPMIDLDGTIAADMKPRADVENEALGSAAVSDANEPRPEVPADR